MLHTKIMRRLIIQDNPHILDLVISNNDDVDSIDHLAPLGKSDHSVLTISVNVWSNRFDAVPKLNFNKGNYSYRLVSLTSVVCKLMESILRDNIMEHFTANKFFSSKQFGFIKGRSTTLQLLQILDIWTECLEQGGQIGVVYTDLGKAYLIQYHIKVNYIVMTFIRI